MRCFFVAFVATVFGRWDNILMKRFMGGNMYIHVYICGKLYVSSSLLVLPRLVCGMGLVTTAGTCDGDGVVCVPWIR